MRKLLLLIGLMVWTVAASAQDKKHLEFEGLEVNGTVASFVQRLSDKGFKHEKGTATLRGKVLGRKATITVASTPDGNMVYLILVTYQNKKRWDDVHNCYESMRMQLEARYGAPVLYKEEFDSPLAEADPIQALEYGNCTFASHFKAPGGEIILAISRDAVVEVYFVDTSNAVSLY